MNKEFIGDLIRVQSELKNPKKDAKNPFFKSTYVPLENVIEAVLPTLNLHNFALVQMPTALDGEPALTTQIIHTSGESLTSTMPLLAKSPEPQQQGSAITYARRYAIMSLLGLVGDVDDDGESTRGKVVPSRDIHADVNPTSAVAMINSAQVDAIRKLSTKLGIEEPDTSKMTFTQAVEEIRKLNEFVGGQDVSSN